MYLAGDVMHLKQWQNSVTKRSSDKSRICEGNDNEVAFNKSAERLQNSQVPLRFYISEEFLPILTKLPF